MTAKAAGFWRSGGVSRLAVLGLLAAWTAAVRAERINWYAPLGSVNLTSTGSLMDAGFHFELGTFTGGFVPGAGNTADWARYWVAAQRVTYNEPNRWFSGVFTVEENAPPFSAGAAAWIWGFRGTPASGEWILFRRSTWTWPRPNPLNPFLVNWSAAAADTVVLGSIQAAGSPFLMQTAAVLHSSPPVTTWAQWSGEMLAGVPGSGPGDDPDGDGSVNLLEFVFGTHPGQRGAPVETPLTWTLRDGRQYLTMRVPRRRDHAAAVVVEVSGDLVTWSSGQTEIVEDSDLALVVRDPVPGGPGLPPRFMRVRAVLP